MSVEPDQLAAVFFLPHRAGWRSLAEGLRQAGATWGTLPAPGAGRPGRYCRWAGWACNAYLAGTLAYQMLVIRFWQSDFLALLPDEEAPCPLAQDPTLPLAHAFREACAALAPSVAYIVTHRHQATHDWLLAHAPAERAGDAAARLLEDVGLLYWTAAPGDPRARLPDLAGHDSLPVAGGHLLFAGSGDPYSRWFGGLPPP